MASTCAMMLALTWGGIRFPWTSVNILVPLSIGLFGLIATLAYESKCPAHPVVSDDVLMIPQRRMIYIVLFLDSLESAIK